MTTAKKTKPLAPESTKVLLSEEKRSLILACAHKLLPKSTRLDVVLRDGATLLHDAESNLYWRTAIGYWSVGFLRLADLESLRPAGSGQWVEVQVPAESLG